MEQKVYKHTIAISNLSKEEYEMIETWKIKVCGGYGGIKTRMLELIKLDLKNEGL